MDYQSAISRRASLRSDQMFRLSTAGMEQDHRTALTKVALDFGVPARFASSFSGDFAKGTPDRESIEATLKDMFSAPGESADDGLYIVASDITASGKIAGAIYNGAARNGMATKWVNFPELATRFGDKISMGTNRAEWDQGDLADWVFELDSMRYCYDLLVVHALDSPNSRPFVATELYNLLSIRAGRSLYTVITGLRGDSKTAAANKFLFQNIIAQQYNGYESEA